MWIRINSVSPACYLKLGLFFKPLGFPKYHSIMGWGKEIVIGKQMQYDLMLSCIFSRAAAALSVKHGALRCAFDSLDAFLSYCSLNLSIVLFILLYIPYSAMHFSIFSMYWACLIHCLGPHLASAEVTGSFVLTSVEVGSGLTIGKEQDQMSVLLHVQLLP